MGLKIQTTATTTKFLIFVNPYAFQKHSPIVGCELGFVCVSVLFSFSSLFGGWGGQGAPFHVNLIVHSPGTFLPRREIP